MLICRLRERAGGRILADLQNDSILFIYEKCLSEASKEIITLNGTRSITLFKSVLDVIHYMDIRDDEAKNVVQKFFGLILDSVLNCNDEENQMMNLEYDTVDKRMHCQLVYVILRTFPNLILLGTNQILPPYAKDNNNSTVADVKSISKSSLNQMVSHDSVAYLTLKTIYDRKLVSFCLLNLDHL